MDTTNRFVGFFDIMGFKDRVNRSTHEEVLEKMYRIRGVLDELKKYSDKYNVYPVFFSDSILLYSTNDTVISAIDMLGASSYLLGKALLEGIPLKGALAYGKLTAVHKKSIYFGQPLIDAYELEKELWMYGAVLHDTMEKFINDNKITIPSLYSYKNTPIKSGGIVMHYTVNWSDYIELCRKSYPTTPTPIEVVSKFYDTSSGHVRRYIENTIKYINSLPKE
jgi:hypothetical protein